MKIGRNQVTGLLLVLIGIIVIVMVSQFSINMTVEYPGPKFFPLIAAVGLVALGLGITLQKNDKKQTVTLSLLFFKRLSIVFCLTIAYLFGLKYLGYLISSPIYLYCVITLFSNEKSEHLGNIWHRFVFSIVFCLLVYCFYVYLFDSKLSVGILFS